MAELKQIFELVTHQIEPDVDAWKEQENLQRRLARNSKTAAIAVAAAIMAAIALFAVASLDRGRDGSAPATVPPGGSGLDFTVVGLDGSIRSAIPGLPDGTMSPDVSPDGTTIAFAIASGPQSQIATMRLDGTGFRIIADDPNSATQPRWSPDGRQLLFYRRDRHGSLHLMAMDADGANVREIRGTRTPDSVLPDWSPDGSLILYTSIAVNGQQDLVTVPATGGRSDRLTTTTSHFDSESGGTWSPDGRSIAFGRLIGARYEIWLMNADGSGQRRLAALPGANAEAPEWSPNGTTIAFIGSVGGIDGSGSGSDAVYVVDVTTGDVTEVLRGVAVGAAVGYGHDSRATWLPDGSALLVMTETP